MSSPRHIREYITAGLFLIALGAGAALWLWGAFAPEGSYAGMRSISKVDMLGQATAAAPAVRQAPAHLAQGEREQTPSSVEELKALSSQADEAINSSLDRNHGFIQLYGGVQRLLGRRILEDVDEQYTVYKLSDGSLTFVNSEPADGLSAYAAAYLEFQDALEERGASLLYLQAPQKIGGEGTPALPSDVIDYGNENADRFLSLITEGGGSSLDFREVLAEDGQLWTSYFYTTDHHWTPEAAMLCTRALTDYMNEVYDLELDTSLADPSRYQVQVYENFFLGSQGKRCGALYAGLDDFTVWTPDFETDFTYTIQIITREGPFEESLLFPERLDRDLFSANPYTFYSGGDYPFTRITNHLNPDGPKIMLLRDSFGCAFTPFLALHCSELTTVDLRYFNADLPTYVDWIDPDYVFLLYSPGSLNNDIAFDFFSEQSDDGTAEKAAE